MGFGIARQTSWVGQPILRITVIRFFCLIIREAIKNNNATCLKETGHHLLLDISAAINAVDSKYWSEIQGVKADSTVVIGHSWGGITALQLAGAQSNSKRLKAKCGNFKHAYRTISWILQCSFQNQVDQPNQRDQRVKSVVAISPPIGLLFNEQAAKDMLARVLLISGTRDVVVPADPEALYPYSHSPENGQPKGTGARER
jgi:predicted dienelactone hydrolase